MIRQKLVSEWVSERTSKRSCARAQPHSHFGHPSFMQRKITINMNIWIACTQATMFRYINVCNEIHKLDWSKWNWFCLFYTLTISALLIKTKRKSLPKRSFLCATRPWPVMCSFRWESPLRLLFSVELFHFLRFKKMAWSSDCCNYLNRKRQKLNNTRLCFNLNRVISIFSLD